MGLLLCWQHFMSSPVPVSTGFFDRDMLLGVQLVHSIPVVQDEPSPIRCLQGFLKMHWSQLFQCHVSCTDRDICGGCSQ